jgi:transcriptional regulator with XRE-family HTH domain
VATIEDEANSTADLEGLGRFVRRRRVSLRLNQTALAQRLGWGQERISLIENGRYGLPSIPQLARLASACECALVDLLRAAGFDPGRDFGVGDGDTGNERRLLQLSVVERLLSISGPSIRSVLTQASNLIGEAVNCEKVDVFLYDELDDVLVALGTSSTPLGKLQHELGLDRLPLSAGGTVARSFVNGVSISEGRVDLDPREVTGIVEELGVRSISVVPLVVDDSLRGVLSVTSREANAFTAEDVAFLQIVARWLGLFTLRYPTDLAEARDDDS